MQMIMDVLISPSKQLTVLLLIFSLCGKNAMSDVCVFFILCMSLPSKLTALVWPSHSYVLFSFSPHWFAWTFLVTHLEQCYKAVVIKHLYVSDDSEQEMYRQVFVYLHFTVGFIETHFNKVFYKEMLDLFYATLFFVFATIVI